MSIFDIINKEEKELEIKEGQQWRMKNNKHCLGQTKIHIVKVFTDPDISKETFIVYRWYGKHKQYWHYTLVQKWELCIMNNRNELEFIK